MEILNQYAVALTILGLVVGAAVYVYGTSKKGSKDILKDNNDALTDFNNTLQAEKAGYIATIKEKDNQLKDREKQIAALQEVATQTPAVTQLIETTNQQHTEVIEQLSSVATSIAKLAEAMTNNTTANVESATLERKEIRRRKRKNEQ